MSEPSEAVESVSPDEATTSSRRRHGLWARAAIGVLAVVGMIWGWSAMVRQKSHAQQRAAEAIVDAGGRIYLDYQWKDGRPFPEGAPPQVAWVRRIVGPHVLDRVVAVDLCPVTQLSEAIEQLPLLPYLVELQAGHAQLTDDALSTVGRLSSLHVLDLSHSAITDEGVAKLRQLTGLRSLNLAHTQVSDAAIGALQRLTQLKRLDLTRTSVSREARRNLGKVLPDCEIVAAAEER